MKITITENQFKKTLIPLLEDKHGQRYTRKYIYAYEFYDKDEKPVAVYVGLSCNITRRSQEHETGRCSWGKSESAVYKFIKDNPHLSYDVVTLEPDNLIPKVAKIKEIEWEKKYRDAGWKILNRMKPGGLGATFQYTNDELRKIAKKYKTYAEWNRNEPSSNLQARRRGREFYDDITSHMKKLHRSYTDDDFRKIAKQYNSKKEWSANDNKSYAMASQRLNKELWDDITSHMKVLRPYYSDDDLRNIAKQYNTKKEWVDNDRNTNNVARKRGKEFYDDITSHMVALRKKYSNDDLRKIAKKYKTYAEWNRNEPATIRVARTRGKEFYDDITSHMNVLKNYYSDDDLRNVAKQYNTKKEWRENEPSSNLQARKRGTEFYDDITSHMKILKNLKKFSDDELRQAAKKYNTKSEWGKKDRKTYVVALKRDKEFYDDITSHMQKLHRSYSNDDLRKIAKQYNSKTEWTQNDYNSWQIAYLKDKEFYDDITSHMKVLKNYYSNDDLRKIAKQYNSKTEWLDNDRNSYATAYERFRKTDEWDDVTDHM